MTGAHLGGINSFAQASVTQNFHSCGQLQFIATSEPPGLVCPLLCKPGFKQSLRPRLAGKTADKHLRLKRHHKAWLLGEAGTVAQPSHAPGGGGGRETGSFVHAVTNLCLNHAAHLLCLRHMTAKNTQLPNIAFGGGEKSQMCVPSRTTGEQQSENDFSRISFAHEGP